MEQITGRVTGNAQIRTTKGGQELVAFTVATNHKYKKKDGTAQEHSSFFDCAYWRSTAIAPHIKQGMVVTVFGNIGLNVYQKQDGEFKASLACHVSTIEFHTGKKESTQATPSGTQGVNAGAGAPETIDDLPF